MPIFPHTIHGLNHLRLRTTHEASIMQVPDCQNTNIGLEIRAQYLLHLVQPVVASMLQSLERRVRFHLFFVFCANADRIPDHPRSPKARNFGLVPNLPSPTPAELGPAALKQLVTWGTLDSTPRIISQTGDPATPFHIPDISAREAMSHKLSDKASRSLRAKSDMFNPAIRGLRFAKTPLSGKKGTMAPPSMTPRRSEAAGNLTPAARRLLHRTTLGTAASRRAEAMEQSAGWDLGARGKDRGVDKVRWTPTPSPVTRR